MQHKEIGKNYVKDLRIAVQESFPSLTDNNANALIMYGMNDLLKGESDYYKGLLESLGLTEQQVYDIAQTYKNNKKDENGKPLGNGTYCN